MLVRQLAVLSRRPRWGSIRAGKEPKGQQSSGILEFSGTSVLPHDEQLGYELAHTQKT